MKKRPLGLWTYSIGLMLCGICGIVLGLRGIFGFQLPDIATRIVGIAGLVGVILLSFATVRYMMDKNKKE